MKVLAINGSPHADGNTSVMLGWVQEELAAAGVETEVCNLAGKPLGGCIDCRLCFKNKDKRCGRSSDALNEIIEKILAVDGIVIGAPTYFANVPGNVKALIERVGYVDIANDGLLRHKIGAAVVVGRRGRMDAYNAINHLFLHREMIVPGSSGWNLGFGLGAQDVENDADAERTMRTLGKNIAWLLKKTLAE